MRDRRRIQVAIFILCVAVALLLWRRSDNRPELDSRAVVTQVRQLNELATVRYTVQKIVGIKEQKTPVGEESILLIMQASVQAGIDLSQLAPDDVSFRPDGSVVIRIPAARILGTTVDEKETKVWDRQKTWWTPWVAYNIDLERQARMEGLKAVEQAARDMGILSQAERNAEQAIRGLLNLAGVRSVTIVPKGTS